MHDRSTIISGKIIIIIIIGNLVAAEPAVLYAPLFYRSLEIDRNRAL
jgi:hypothetical protein